MVKKYLDKNVYELSLERIKYLFEEFDNVLVAISGGKDSGVCLNLCYDYAKENNMLYKLGMYHLDYEAQYQMTTDYIEETFKKFDDIKRFWICLEIKAQCCCNMHGAWWKPWNHENKDIWVRKKPTYDYVINEDNVLFPYQVGDIDYDVLDNFDVWFSKQFGNTAFIIGIRAQESLDRFRAIKSKKKVNVYKGKNYINSINGITHKAYPIYDWDVEDIWVYNAKFEKPYNKLYDLFYQAGLSINQMRVASPFNDSAGATLKMYRVIDPNTWGKMVGRVNGVNCLSIYGDTYAMGWKSIKKPSHFTWKEYCYFLLDTLDEKTREHYLKKLNTSIKHWKNTGSVLDQETIQELERDNVDFVNRGKVSKASPEKDVITIDDYLDDTNVTKFSLIPTYKRMCICIMKNDYFCKYMGFAQTKEEMAKRKRAIEKYNSL